MLTAQEIQLENQWLELQASVEALRAYLEKTEFTISEESKRVIRWSIELKQEAMTKIREKLTDLAIEACLSDDADGDFVALNGRVFFIPLQRLQRFQQERLCLN